MISIKKDKKWFAIYVKSRNEKKVFKSFGYMGIEAFLPLIVNMRQWSDRKKKIEEPLFRSYIFVHTDLKDYYDILNCKGVVKFIIFEGEPVTVPDNQILAIKSYIEDSDRAEIYSEDLHKGELVQIKSGIMKGLVGRLIEIRRKTRLIINIESVGKYIPINISRSKVEPC